MQVSKWGNSLAVRIPDDVAEAMGLKEGDEVDLTVVSAPAEQAEREKALEYIRSRRWTMPPGWRFDRDEANER